MNLYKNFKIINFCKFFTGLMHSFSQAQGETGYSYSIAPLAELLRISWQKNLNIECLCVCTALFQCLIHLYGGHYSSVQLPLKVTLRFPASRKNTPQQMMIFLDIILMTAQWLVCCNRELMQQVLKLLEMVYTNNLKGA